MNAAAAEGKKGNYMMVTFGVPDDPKFLAALGTVTVLHAHLEHMLKMTIKTLAGVSFQEAMDAAEYQMSRKLRGRIEELAESRLGEGQALIKLQALLRRCARATKRRNNIVHGVVGRNFDKEGEFMHVSSRGLEPLPAVGELNSLATKLAQLTNELNNARLQGFLAEALKSR